MGWQVYSKIIGQIGLGIIIGVTLYFSNAVTVEREVLTTPSAQLQKRREACKGFKYNSQKIEWNREKICEG